MKNADDLLSGKTVRKRCEIVFAAAQADATPHFRLVPERLDDVVDRVVTVTLRRYPDLQVPYHGRVRHFEAGGINRLPLVAPGATAEDVLRSQIGLVVVSVLLDAGAGPLWSFLEAQTGQTFTRSEGLGVASLRAVEAGLFTSEPTRPWSVDAVALRQLTEAGLAHAFQHNNGNKLVGLQGRLELLRRLGKVASASPQFFGSPACLGNLLDCWLPYRDGLPADRILNTILRAMGSIWPGRLNVDGVDIGDCGFHSAVGDDGLVPFHKLSQWMTYSLVELLEAAGFRITDLDELTGLPEYRNGGLFLDCGVIEPRDPSLPSQVLDANSEPVVEWRALTVALLDRLAERVRKRLGKTEKEFPLARVLEGGSWAAGREIALERRPDGAPPLLVSSDGTRF
jgi:hypothetical protein